jgi:CBS domain-containing protein
VLQRALCTAQQAPPRRIFSKPSTQWFPNGANEAPDGVEILNDRYTLEYQSVYRVNAMSTIRDILGRKGKTVLTSKSSASVLEAISLMSQANIGALVIQDDDQPCGIFTERDYLRKIALKGRSSSSTALYDVMSSPLITVPAADTPEAAMEIMTTCRCRHLIVTEGEKMVGIISLGDLVKHLLQEKEAEVEHLAQYIAGSY